MGIKGQQAGQGAWLSLVGFLLVTPLLFGYLGEASYGLVAIAASALTYLGVFGVGLGSALSHEVASAQVQGDRLRSVALIQSSLTLFVAVGLTGFVLFALLATQAEGLFRLPQALAWSGGAFLLIKGIELGFALLARALAGAIHGLQRGFLSEPKRALAVVSELGAGLLVVWLNLGLVGLAWLGVLGALFVGVARWRMLRSLLPELRLRWALPRLSLLGRSGEIGVFFAVESLSVALLYATDALVIGLATGASAVALYAIVARLSGLLGQSAHRLVRALQPPLLPPEPVNELQRPSQALFAQAMDGALLVSGGLSILFVAFGAEVMGRWLGLESIGSALVVVFGLLILISAPILVASELLSIAGQRSWSLKVSVIEALANLVLSLVFVIPLGPLGVALATLSSRLVGTTWILPRMACAKLGMSWVSFASQRLLRIFVFGAPTALVAWALRYYQAPESALELGGQVVVCALIHLVVGYTGWMIRSRRALP